MNWKEFRIGEKDSEARMDFEMWKRYLLSRGQCVLWYSNSMIDICPFYVLKFGEMVISFDFAGMSR